MEDISCPACGGTRLTKYGKAPSGKQKYKCRACRHQFVDGSDHFIAPEVMERVKTALAAGVSPDAIAAIEKGAISKRWICELRRRMKNDQRPG